MMQSADIPVVGAREPCPCGSGRRYKACHGKAAAQAAVAFSARPFEGLPREGSFVAMREILPAATMRATTHSGDALVFVTILPEQVAAMRTSDGSLLIAMQTPTGTGDASRDLASALVHGLSLTPGDVLSAAPIGFTQRLQELLAGVEELQLQDSFAFWQIEDEQLDDLAHSIVPTSSLAEDAYWCGFPDRTVVRWVIADEEDAVIDTLARLSAAGTLRLGESSKYLGAFRADGILIPVWEVMSTALEAKVEIEEFQKRFLQTRTISTPLSDAERRARSGVIGRNLTLR